MNQIVSKIVSVLRNEFVQDQHHLDECAERLFRPADLHALAGSQFS
ncbi:hypothetical protein [Rhodococcus sp. EPR-157]|nr:hypothetical protein [Rhodococcus sp. EPR-157]